MVVDTSPDGISDKGVIDQSLVGANYQQGVDEDYLITPVFLDSRITLVIKALSEPSGYVT